MKIAGIIAFVAACSDDPAKTIAADAATPTPDASTPLDSGGVDPDPDAGGGPVVTKTRYVFVTKTDYAGYQPNGVEDHDAACNTEATAVAKLAGKKFVAWLSTSQATAPERTGVAAFDGTYRLTTDVAVGNAKAFRADQLETAIKVTAAGDARANSAVWTGTRMAGARDANASCTDWKNDNATAANGRAGLFGARNLAWTDNDSKPCLGESAALYCFEAP